MFKLLSTQNVSRRKLHEAGTTHKDLAQDAVPSLCPPDCVYGKICEMGAALRKGSLVRVPGLFRKSTLSMWVLLVNTREISSRMGSVHSPPP